MPSVRRLRAAVALVSFTVAAVAGWFAVSVRAAKAPRVIPVVADKVPAPAAADPTIKSPVAGLVALEKSLTALLDPARERYNGERLLELCRADGPKDGPGYDEKFTYARRWAEQAPQEMFEWFLQRGAFTLPAAEENHRYSFLGNLFGEWAKRDAKAAMAAALRCPQKRDRAEAVMTVVAWLRATDPARAAALAAENIAHFSGIGHAFSAFGEGYRDTWHFLAALPAGRNRGEALARFFDDVTRYHGGDCAALWNEMTPEIRQEIVAAGFSGIYLGRKGGIGESPAAPNKLEGLEDLQRQHIEAAYDPEAARRYLHNNGSAWAERDPAAAIAWAQQHLKGELRVKGTAQLFGAGAVHHFDEMLPLWQSLPDGMLKARAVGAIAGGAPTERSAEVEALLAGLSHNDRMIAGEAREHFRAQRTREQMLDNVRRTFR